MSDRERRAPDNITIRLANLADEAALRSFRCQAPGEPWAAAPEVTVTTYVPAWIRDRSAHVWVADEAGRIVGVIALTIDDADETVAVSQVLAVTVDRRRCYIGYELKRTALAWFQGEGGRLVYSEVDEHNAAMRACNHLFEAVEDHSDEAGLLDVVVQVTE